MPPAILPAGVPLLASAGRAGAGRARSESTAARRAPPAPPEVKEQFEALVGVVVGEAIGEVHEVRDAVGREGGHVVAGHRGGLARLVAADEPSIPLELSADTFTTGVLSLSYAPIRD